MTTQKGVSLPDDLADALTANPHLLTVLERMRPSCQRVYAKWVDEAKKAETRSKRIASVLAAIAGWGERHQEALQDHREIRRAKAELEAWRRNPSISKSLEQLKAELIAEGELDA